jgi:branched-chain amino acid aminotransferase
MAGFTKTDFIWMNGAMVPWDDAQVHVSAHGLQYGTGVFEGMRSYETADGTAIFRLDAHMKRFIESANAYELDIPYSVDELCEASLEVVRANKLTNAYFRPLAFFDSKSFSVWPKDCPVTVAIIAVPGRQYIQGGPDQGARVMLSTVRRIDAAMLPPQVKACGHYTNSVRAVQEAIRNGYDDAILLNMRGDVSEGSGANLFYVKDGTVITSDLDSSILNGITRDSVIQIARDLGIPVKIQRMPVEDVRAADEMFYTGTAVEVTPIRELDGKPVGTGKPGPITLRIQSTFYDAVHGKLPQYRGWLSFAQRTSDMSASALPLGSRQKAIHSS